MTQASPTAQPPEPARRSSPRLLSRAHRPIVRDARLVSDDQFDEARLRSLYRVSKLVTADLNLDSTLRAVIDAARSLIQADMVGILLLEENTLVVRATSGLLDDLIGERVSVDESLIGRSLATSRAFLVADLLEQERSGHTGLDERHQARCFIVAPLVRESRALGVLAIGSREPGALTEGDLALAVALAEQAATAVANAHAYNGQAARRAASDELAQELARRTEALETAQHQLVTNEKVTAIGQLAAGIAHEINTPLSVVMSNLHVMERYGQQLGTLIGEVESAIRNIDADVPDELRQAFVDSDAEYILGDLPSLTQRSVASAGRVAEIVRSVAAFAGKDVDNFTSVDLAQVIESALTLAWNSLKARAEIVRLVEPLPRISGQASALTQMFVHLLVNAALAMDAAPGFLTIEGRIDEDSLLVRISDTGHGIGPEELPRVFDPFFTTRPQGQGTGLGLSVCHGIVTRHGGSMSIESELGSGTSVTVRFPLADAARQPRLKEAA